MTFENSNQQIVSSFYIPSGSSSFDFGSITIAGSEAIPTNQPSFFSAADAPASSGTSSGSSYDDDDDGDGDGDDGAETESDDD